MVKGLPSIHQVPVRSMPKAGSMFLRDSEIGTGTSTGSEFHRDLYEVSFKGTFHRDFTGISWNMKHHETYIYIHMDEWQ